MTTMRSLALLALVAVLSACGDSGWSKEQGKQQSAADTDRAIQNTEAQEALALRKQETGLARARTEALVDEGRAVLGRLEALDALEKAWRAEVEPLLTNDMGRKVAADPGDRATMVSIIESTGRPSADEIARLRADVQRVLNNLEKTLELPVPALSASSEQDVRESFVAKRAAAEDGINRYTTDRRAVGGLLVRAEGRRDAASHATLEEAMKLQLAEKARERAARIAEERVKAYEEKTDEIVELERRAAEAAAAKEAAELAKSTGEAEAEVRQAELVAKCRSKDVRDRLAPLLKRHNVTIGGTMLQTPVLPSLRELKMLGYLEPTEDGLNKFILVGCERGSWTQPQSDAEWQEMKDRQKLLRELGPTLVDLGMLGR